MATEAVHRAAPAATGQIMAVTRYELLRHLRRRRLIIMLVLLAILVALPLGLPPLLGVPFSADPYRFVNSVLGTGAGSFSGVHILVILAATFFGGDALLGEFEAKTGYLIFPKPVRRSTLFAGKLFASLALSVGIVSVLYMVGLVAVQIHAGTIPVELFYSWGLALLYTTAALAVAFLLSSSLRSAAAASVLTFFLFFLILRFVDFGLSAGHIRPNGSLTFASEVVSNILSGPYPQAYPNDTQIPTRGGSTVTSFVAPVDLSIVVMALYAVVASAVAMVIFRRREMKG